MTDIPGTGKIPIPEIKKDSNLHTPMSTVNISELKKGEIEPIKNESLWYGKIQFWLIPGVFLSLIFILISLKYKNFIVFIPVGPIVSIVSWYVKKLLKKYEPKPKKYST
jgi:hypothetical protein